MGCGQKAVADDEDDWDRFRKITDLKDFPWDCYSQQAFYAREGFNKYHLKRNFLSRYVALRMEIDSLIKQQRSCEAEYETYLALKKKFEQ